MSELEEYKLQLQQVSYRRNKMIRCALKSRNKHIFWKKKNDWEERHCSFSFDYKLIYFLYITFQVEAALTLDPENEDLIKLRADLQVLWTIWYELTILRNNNWNNNFSYWLDLFQS